SPEDWTALSGCRYWVEACFRTGRYEEAVQACRHFSTRRFSAASERELSSTVGLVYILSGLAWIRLGEGLKAEEDLCYAVQYPLPLRSQSLLTVGHALLWLRRRDFGTAQRLLNEGLEKLQRVYSPRGRLLPLLRPRAEWQYSFILTVRGEVWAAQEVYSRAQGALEEALEYWPWNPEALLRLGEVFAAQNRLANARQAWQQVVHLGEEGPHAQTAQERLKSR
ncbi:MAG TPA: tetratricopeptide repeat protein, partial [Armatimonadetes bacterium]|nr:tetratricopeptide repeat protein [Armatimonadota bacterium]